MPRALILAMAVAGLVALAFALVWIAPAIGTTNSACERYPFTSGCR
jgi:hypothetical protein